MLNYKFYIRVDTTDLDSDVFSNGSDHVLWGGAWYQVYPGVNRDIEKSWVKDGEFRWREELSGELWFTNRNAGGSLRSDYTILSQIDSTSVEVEIRIEQTCGVTSASDFWNGYFSIIDCSWDSDRGVVIAKPSPNDKYRPYKELGERKYNLKALNPSSDVSIQVDSVAQIVYSECTSDNFTEWQAGHDPDGNVTVDRDDRWDLYAYVNSTACPGGLIHEYRKENIDFDPDDLSWVNEGVAQYDNNFGVWSKNETSTQTVSLEFGNGRWLYLKDAISYIISDIGDTSYKSTFFENDTLVGGASGGTDNYVTSVDPNPLNDQLMTQKSNIKPTSDPATKWLISFNELMDLLRDTWNVDWFVDDDDNFRIEHYSYFQKTVDTDLTALDSGRWIGAKNKWTYDTPNMPNREHFEFMESSGEDFIGKDIVYNRIATGNRYNDNQKDYLVGITTDVPYMVNEPDKISNEGWAFVTNDGGYIRNETGVLTGDLIINGHLSWANLHDAYWKHGRVISVGSMNDVNTNFSDYQKTLKQIEITYPQCGADFDPDGLKTTELGDGEVGEARYRLLDGTITTVFFYPNVKSVNPPPEESYLVKTSDIWLVLANNIDNIKWYG